MMIIIMMKLQINQKSRILIHHLQYHEITKDLIVNLIQERRKIIQINKRLNVFCKIIMMKRIYKNCWMNKVMMSMIMILEMLQIKKMIK